MAVLKIVRMGHPVLMAPASPVEDPTAAEIRSLADDLVETMRAAPGIGLAAPQVAVGLRVVVYCVPGHRTETGVAHPLTVLINPRVSPLTADTELGIEGCLSLPGMQGMVPRPTRVRVQAIALDGAPLDYEASGFHARVVCHECDHLDGIVYPMRMPSLETFGYVAEMTPEEDQRDAV